MYFYFKFSYWHAQLKQIRNIFNVFNQFPVNSEQFLNFPKTQNVRHEINTASYYVIMTSKDAN